MSNPTQHVTVPLYLNLSDYSAMISPTMEADLADCQHPLSPSVTYYDQARCNDFYQREPDTPKTPSFAALAERCAAEHTEFMRAFWAEEPATYVADRLFELEEPMPLLGHEPPVMTEHWEPPAECCTCLQHYSAYDPETAFLKGADINGHLNAIEKIKQERKERREAWEEEHGEEMDEEMQETQEYCDVCGMWQPFAEEVEVVGDEIGEW